VTGRYNPTTATRGRATSTGSQRAAAHRFWHRAVWTGSENARSGAVRGKHGSQLKHRCGRYSAVNEQPRGAPDIDRESRAFLSAVMTSSEVWTGTRDGVDLDAESSDANAVTNSGGRYSPALDAWAPTIANRRRPHCSDETRKRRGPGPRSIVWGGTTVAHADLNERGGR
jgi:hypothetical protein